MLYEMKDSNNEEPWENVFAPHTGSALQILMEY